MLEERILKQYREELIKIRRHFHRYPELANEEFETAKYIADYLSGCGLEIKNGLANTGLVGILKGSAGPSIAIRTEMDALPIHEENDVEYRSSRANIMHACGHDGHMAVALLTAKLLSGKKDRLKGNVIFIFQPAEENLPEGGAKRMLEEAPDIFDGLKAIFGFHFWPFYKSGTVAVSKSDMMAAGDVFEVVFKGVGAHGANPHQSSDVLMMTSDAILSLTSIISRNIKPGTLATLSVGVVKGGESPNVLPAASLIKGTTRYVDAAFQKNFPEKIHRVLDGVCKAYDGDYELIYRPGYPLLKNNPALAEIVLASAAAVIHRADVVEVTAPALTSEDFAVYLDRVPGCYFWVGTQSKQKDIINLLHSPRFDLDEEALLTALEMYLLICMHILG